MAISIPVPNPIPMPTPTWVPVTAATAVAIPHTVPTAPGTSQGGASPRRFHHSRLVVFRLFVR